MASRPSRSSTARLAPPRRAEGRRHALGARLLRERLLHGLPEPGGREGTAGEEHPTAGAFGASTGLQLVAPPGYHHDRDPVGERPLRAAHAAVGDHHVDVGDHDGVREVLRDADPLVGGWERGRVVRGGGEDEAAGLAGEAVEGGAEDGVVVLELGGHTHEHPRAGEVVEPVGGFAGYRPWAGADGPDILGPVGTGVFERFGGEVEQDGGALEERVHARHRRGAEPGAEGHDRGERLPGGPALHRPQQVVPQATDGALGGREAGAEGGCVARGDRQAVGEEARPRQAAHLGEGGGAEAVRVDEKQVGAQLGHRPLEVLHLELRARGEGAHGPPEPGQRVRPPVVVVLQGFDSRVDGARADPGRGHMGGLAGEGLDHHVVAGLPERDGHVHDGVQVTARGRGVDEDRAHCASRMRWTRPSIVARVASGERPRSSLRSFQT